MKKIIIIIIAVILVAILLALGTYKILTKPVSKNIEEKKIEIPLGSGTSAIADILKENKLIRSKNAFKIYVKLNKISNFQAGTYYLKESMTLKEITDMLQTGIMYDPNQTTITYLEGKPMWWLAEAIETKTNHTQEEVYELLKNEEYLDTLIAKYWFLTDEIKNADIYYSLEGYLFPDTYAIANKDEKIEDIFGKMLDRMEEVLEPFKEEIENSNYTVHELLTLASVVETEGMNDSDRKDVASVFYNRLKNNISLGSDVTTYYAAKIDLHERDLYKSELNDCNKYNTRSTCMNGKLPVGPICNMSVKSIEASVNPSKSDYYYFVADKNGKTYFNKTDSAHVSTINKLKKDGLWFEY